MRIRRLVEQVDEQHREAMRTIEDDLGELHFGTRSAAADESRRRFVRSLGVGGAVALGAVAVPTAVLATAAGAQTSGSSSDEEELPEGDLAIVEFAVGLELAAEAAYTAAVDTKLFDSVQAEVARTFGRHHHEHAVALATLAGRDADTVGFANTAIVDAVAPRIQAGGTANGVWEILFGVENGAAATYLEALGTLESVTAAGPAATILPIESQHATVIGSMIELPVDEWMPPFQTTEGAFDPATYAG
jgi:hypothetical protein